MGVFFNASTFQQDRQRIKVVGSKDYVDIRRALNDVATIFLRQASPDRNLKLWVLFLDWNQLAKRAIKFV